MRWNWRAFGVGAVWGFVVTIGAIGLWCAIQYASRFAA